MKKNMYRYIGFIVTIIVLVVCVIVTKSSCTSTESPMEPTEVTATDIPTNEPTAVPTNAPTATPTSTPTPEPTPVPEITVEPEEPICEVSEAASNEDEYEEMVITAEPTEEPTETPAPTNEEEPVKKKKIKSSSLSEVLQRGYCLYEVRESYGTYMLEPEYQAYLYDMCVKYGVEKYYKLMMAVMWHESNFNVKEISKTNDYGLMQINICNHSWLKKTLDIDPDFLNPYTSMECGVYMMSSYLLKYDDVHKALVAYNRGDNAVDKQGMTESSYSRTVVDILVNKIFKIEGSEDYDDVVVTAEPTPTEEVIPTEEPTPTDVEEEPVEEASEEDGVTSLEDIPSLEEMGEEY